MSVALAVDANATPISTSVPSNLVDLNGTLLFTHDDGRRGVELFASDGTASGTRLVKDIRPGSLGSTPSALTRIGDKVYFSAYDGSRGFEPWVTDGTAAGTRKLFDASGGFGSSGFTQIADGSVLFFGNRSGTSGGYELWRTDGTPAGTRSLKPLNSALGFDPTDPVLFNGALYFLVGGSTAGGELWRSDGTTAGTVRVQAISGNSPVKDLTVVGNRLFYSTAYKNLYTTDGSLNGAALVATVGTGGTFSGGVNVGGIANLRALDNRLFFTANDGSTGVELWAADATHAYRVKDIYPGASSASPSRLTALNGKLYFAASDFLVGNELWVTDGTEANTTVVRDLRAGTLSSSVSNLTAVGGRLWFGATGDGGSGLYTSDGTTAGTTLVKAIAGSSTAVNRPSKFTAAGGNVFFAAGDSEAGIELWKTSAAAPAAATTGRVRDLFVASATAQPRFIGTVNGKLIYFADDGVNGFEPWFTDGTPGGSGLLKNLRAGSDSSIGTFGNPRGQATSQYLYFAASDGSATTQLYRTDGTPGGTVALRNFTSEISSWSVLNDRVFFTINNLLYTSDGTAAGTVSVSSNFGFILATLDNVLYTARGESTFGNELWRSDGTALGTYRVTDINPGSGSSTPDGITVVGDSLYFFADLSSTSGNRLFKYTPATDVTTYVKDVIPGRDDYSYGSRGAAGGRFVFSANDYVIGEELYVSDGTAAGTGLLGDLVAGSGSSRPAQFISLGDAILFEAGDYNAEKLWRSDGTVAGTYVLNDVNPEYHSTAGQTNFLRVGDLVYFAAEGSRSGIWRSDGTAAGTYMVSSLDPGGLSYAGQLAAAGDRLFFSADDYLSGVEVWTYRPDAAPLIVQTSRFDTDAGVGGGVRLTLNRLASLELMRGTLSFINRSTNTSLLATDLTLALDAVTGDVLIRTANGKALPNGDYRIVLPPGAFTDAALNPLASSTTVDFFVYAGDANHDRVINFDDLLIVAQSFGKTGRTFSQGDFDYSGAVDFDDLLTLAKGFGQSLPGVANVQAASFNATTTAAASSSRRRSAVSEILG